MGVEWVMSESAKIIIVIILASLPIILMGFYLYLLFEPTKAERLEEMKKQKYTSDLPSKER
jgi:hypothetical protein